MSSLKPLVWVDVEYSAGMAHDAQGAAVYYRAVERNGKHVVYWMDNVGGSDGDKEFSSLDDLKHWVDTDHYPHKMQPYLERSPTWIDAKTRLPQVDCDTQFICAYDSAIEPFVKITHFDKALNEFGYEHGSVLAWMPVPSVPNFGG